MQSNRLLWRRQFLMTSKPSDSFSGWQYLKFAEYHVYVHPDLPVHRYAPDGSTSSALLLGHVLAPVDRGRRTVDTLSRAVACSSSVEKLAAYVATLSGRFVLVVATDSERFVFHDPCGLRSVYYANFAGDTYLASQPRILQEVAPLRLSSYAEQYLASEYVANNIEHWLPSGCCLLDGVGHLLPNHYLRLRDLKQVRYWPSKRLEEKSVREVVRGAAKILKDSLENANSMFDLALPLTGGWDSRVLLAAARGFCEDLYVYTLLYRDLNTKSNDVAIPNQIARSMGLRHQIIDCRTEATEEFRITYEQNALPAHWVDWGTIAFGMSRLYPEERVCLKGNCSEIARCFYYKTGSHAALTSYEDIVQIEKGWGQFQFVCDHIENWYEQAVRVCEDTNVDILDLFYWEHRLGSWQAQSQLEWDIVQEAFAPFNNRVLLELLLASPAQLRVGPRNVIYRNIIRTLWPELNRFPVNPVPFQERLRQFSSGGRFNRVLGRAVSAVLNRWGLANT